MFSARFLAAGILFEGLAPNAKFAGNEGKDIHGRNFVDAKYPARKSEVG